MCIGATVSYEEVMFYGREGEGDVEVCLVITNVPEDGLECNVSVSLSAVDGLKTGMYLCTVCRRVVIFSMCERSLILSSV